MSTSDVKKDSRSLEKKWGKGVVSAGFTALPNHLIGLNQYLDEDEQLTPTEMLVLLQILASWWSVDRLPFPSKTTIGRRSGLSSRQVQRALGSLENKGFLKKITRYNEAKGRTSNAYDFEGLIKKVSAFVEAQPSAFKRTQKGPDQI